jgi:hypothetical protein
MFKRSLDQPTNTIASFSYTSQSSMQTFNDDMTAAPGDHNCMASASSYGLDTHVREIGTQLMCRTLPHTIISLDYD